MRRAQRHRLAPGKSNHRRLRRLWPIAALVAAGAVLAAMLVPLSAQADTVALSGVVRNAGGTTLTGVGVSAVPIDGAGAPASTVSGSGGTFAFAALSEGTYTLKFGATSTTFAQYLGNTASLSFAETIDLFHGADNQDQSYITATLSNSGTISGTVSKLPSGALKSYTVRAFSQASDGTWSANRSTVTSSSGGYSLTGLQPGDYRLEAIDLTSAHPTYSPAFSGGATSVDAATPVGVVAGKTSSYNFALGKAGTVTGSVVGLYNGTHTEDVPGTRVSVYRVDNDGTANETDTALDSPSTVTGAAGQYSISGLAPGRYTLEFQPPSTPTVGGGQVYGQTFLGNHSDATHAETFLIVDGNTASGYGIVVNVEGVVSGTVSDGSGPLANVRVSIDYAGRDQDLPGEDARSVLTDPDGAYSFAGLGPGDYDLWVGSNTDSNPNDGVPENTNYVRRVVSVDGGVTAGATTHVAVTLTEKVDDALISTTAPTMDNDGTGVDDSVSVNSNGSWTDSSLGNADFSYQWTRDGKPIPDATGGVYNLEPGDMGHAISAIVTASDFGYGTASAQATGGFVVQPGTIDDPTPTPTVSGTNAVGGTLTVSQGEYNVSGVLVTYDWRYYNHATSQWVPIGAPSSPSHLITQADYEHSSELSVMITASRDGYADDLAYAAPTGFIGQGTLSLITSPTIKKTATGFTVVGGVWSPSTFDSIDYDWNVYNQNGNQLATSTAAVLPLAGTAGNTVTLILKHNLEGYASSYSPELTAQLADPPVASGSLALSGTPQVDVDVSAPSVTWTPSSGSSTYQWQYKSGSSWKNVAAAGTNGFYAPVVADLGRHLRLVITRHVEGLQDAVLDVQASSAVVLGQAAGDTAAPIISGTPGTGDTLSTTTGSWNYPVAAYSYQWEWTDNFEFGTPQPITGATKSTFVVPQNLIDDYIIVKVTAKVVGHQDGSANGYLSNTSLTVSKDHLTPVKAPTVSHKGTVYTVKGGTFSPASTDTKYLWEYFDESSSSWVLYRTDTPMAGATSASIDLSTAEPEDSRWGVAVAGNAAGYTQTAATTMAIAGGAIDHSGQLDLPPASIVDQPISPTQPTWNVTSPSLKYQWRMETNPSSGVWKNITGATAATFTPSGKYVNQELDVVETASKASYASEVVVSRPTNANAADAPTAGTSANAPTITGDDNVGSTLTAHPGTWSTTGLSFSYTWQVSTNGTTWTPVPGATSASYLIPDSAIDTDYFQVTITAKKLGYEDATATVATAAVADFGTLTPATTPKVTVKNGTYTVTGGTWKPAVTAPLTYSWAVWDPATATPTTVGSNSNTYTPAPLDAAKEITVTVGAHRDDYTNSSQRVVAHAGPAITSSTPVAITGTAVLGGDLTVSSGTWSTPSPTIAVEWLVNGAPLAGTGTATTLHLSAPYLGKKISAKVTVSLYGYATATYTTPATTPVVSDFVLATTVTPVISGTPKVDDTLSVSTGTWNATGLTYSYQWYRNGRAIRAATSASYVLDPADDGQEVTAGVTASKTNLTPVQVRPDTVTVDDGDAVAPTGAALTVMGPNGGSPRIGDVESAKLGSFPLAVTVTYSWLVYNQATPGWHLIAGARSNTYTVSAADGIVAGSELEAEIFVERAGHTSVSYTSGNVVEVVSTP